MLESPLADVHFFSFLPEVIFVRCACVTVCLEWPRLLLLAKRVLNGYGHWIYWPFFKIKIFCSPQCTSEVEVDNPIGSMYGWFIYLYIYHQKSTIYVGKYTIIHGNPSWDWKKAGFSRWSWIDCWGLVRWLNGETPKFGGDVVFGAMIHQNWWKWRSPAILSRCF